MPRQSTYYDTVEGGSGSLRIAGDVGVRVIVVGGAFGLVGWNWVQCLL